MSLFSIQLKINPNLFLKDPQQTKLGRKIIRYGIVLLDEIGLDQLTFKKLAKLIPSSEASIYRYFENKHNLFVYLLNWHWELMSVRIKMSVINITDPIQKLQSALSVIVGKNQSQFKAEHIDENMLFNIVVREGAKAYHHKGVDADNNEGYFLSYKELCEVVSTLIMNVKHDFSYPNALASTLIETANSNLYFAKHLPRLTDITQDEDLLNLKNKVLQMLQFFCFSILQSELNPDNAEGYLESNRQTNN